MGVKKSFSFAAGSPYRSRTFNENNALVFNRKGLLSDLALRVDGLNLVIGPYAFVQNGLVVSKDTETIEPLPTTLEAPYHVVVSSPDNRPTDNIIVDFVRRPEDLTPDQVPIGTWDGVEWRPMPRLDIGGLVDARRQGYQAHHHVGFNVGCPVTADAGFTQYGIGVGLLTDKFGDVDQLTLPRTFSPIGEDVDYPRIDELVYRRPGPQRIGRMQLFAGLTYGDKTPIKAVTYGDGSRVNSLPKILHNAAGEMLLFWSENYGDNQILRYMKYAADKTSVVVTPKTVCDLSNGGYDVVIDKDGNICVIAVHLKRLVFKKLSQVGATIVDVTPIETNVNQYADPKIFTDLAGYFYVLARYQAAPTTWNIHFIRLNPLGMVATSAVNTGIDALAFDASWDHDYVINVAYSGTDGRVYRRTLSDVGGWIDSARDIGAGNTPRVFICDNREDHTLYLFAGQLYCNGVLLISETITSYTAVVDLSNHIHVFYRTGSSFKHSTFWLPRHELRGAVITLSGTPAAFACDFDPRGALAIAQDEPSGSTSPNGSALAARYYGPNVYGSELTYLAATEFALPTSTFGTLSPVPTVGDTVTISSAGSNNGTYTITGRRTALINSVSHEIVQVTASFSALDSLLAAAQFYQVTGNDLTVSKLPALTEYNFADILARELSTDITAMLIKRPSNEMWTWNTNALIPADGQVRVAMAFLTSAARISFLSNTLTWTQPIVIKDPFHGKLTIPAGSSTILDDEFLYVKLPKINRILVDGGTDGAGTLRVADSSQYALGMEVYIGDADSAGIYATVTNIVGGIITVDQSTADYQQVRGGYVTPAVVSLQRAARNTGDLRPDSDGRIDSSVFPIWHRTLGIVFACDGSLSLSDDEEGWLGEGPGEDVLRYIGAASETDSDPNYSSNYAGTQGESLTTRTGALDKLAHDAAQDRNILDIQPEGVLFDWDATTGVLSWAGGDWSVQIPDVGATPGHLHTIVTSAKQITGLADGKVAYVVMSRTTGTGDLAVTVVDANALPLNLANQNLLVIARRIGATLFVGTCGQTRMYGSTIQAPEEADKMVKLVGSHWYWNATANTLQWTQAAYFEHPGLPLNRNRIPAGSDNRLTSDGDILYVDINRKGGPAADLTLQYGNIASVPKGPNRFVVARRVGTTVYVGSMRLEDDESSPLERPMTDQMMQFVGQPTSATVLHNYYSTSVIKNTMSHEEALSELDASVNIGLSYLPMLLPPEEYSWEGDGSTTHFEVGVGGFGSDQTEWLADASMTDILVTGDGLKYQQRIGPSMTGPWNFEKSGTRALDFAAAPDPGEIITARWLGKLGPMWEYAWVADGSTTDYTIGVGGEGHEWLVWDPLNTVSDINVWVERFERYPDIPLGSTHDFTKLSDKTIRLTQTPLAGELVVVRGGYCRPEMARVMWIGDGSTTQFRVGENSEGSPYLKWWNRTDIKDIWVTADGIKQDAGASRDFVKTRADVIVFNEAPAPGVKISVHGVYVYVSVAQLTVRQEGAAIEVAVREIDFRGPGVSVTKTEDGKVAVDISGGGGGGGTSFSTTKGNNTGSAIPAHRLVYFTDNNQMELCDSTVVGKQHPQGITTALVADGATGNVQYGGDISGGLAGSVSLFNWTDKREVFLGLNGELVNYDDLPDTAAPTDKVIKVGEVSGTGPTPTGFVWCVQDFGDV